jgi:hypothetical protein
MNNLSAQTAPPLTWDTFFKGKPDKFFRGQVGGEHFEIFHTIRGRDSMLPVITGWVATNESGLGSVLRIRHRLHVFSLILVGVWLSFSGVMAVEIVLDWFTTGFDLFGLLFFLPFFVGCLFFSYSFWQKVKKSRSFLMRLLVLTPLDGA